MPKDRGFYGWIALAGAALVYFTTSGAFYYSYGVFLPTLCNEYGWSRTLVGGALSIGLLALGLPSPLIGASIARFGPKANIVFGNSLMAFGLAGMSIATKVWQLYLFYGILGGLGAGFGLYMASTAVVNNWFIKKRSMAMGILISSGGLGGFAFPPLATWLISSFGLQMAWLANAMIVLVCSVLIGGWILIRNGPEEMGQTPDSISTAHARALEGETRNTSRVYQSPVNWQTGQAIRNPTIWLIATLCSTSSLAVGTVTAHQVAYLMDIGFSPIVAAMTLALVSGMSILGRLGFGLLGVRFGVRHLAIFSSFAQVIALLILTTAKSLPLIYTYSVIFGISSGALIVALPEFIGAYYGRMHYSQILGLIFPLILIAEAAGPVIAGSINDAIGTYILAFVTITGLSTVGLVCAIFAYPPKAPGQESMEWA
jgi:MFS family permease